MEWLHRFLSRFNLYQYFLDWTKVVYLPGFRPLPLYTVASFFFKEIKQDSLVNRASSLAYSFLLATFPVFIFLFTLIPYIPIKNFPDTLNNIIATILPTNAYLAFENTIQDILKHQNLSLLSFGFLSAMIFATNGVAKLMTAFNKSSLVEETRTWLKRRWIALVLTILIALTLFVAIIILIIGGVITNFLQKHFHGATIALVLKYVIMLVRWVIVISLFFVTIAILYRYGPANKRKWKFVSPGSILATTLAVLTSMGFSFYINNFSSYNKVYGSIGTLIVVMLWLYLNSLIILIGFELNASIDLSKRTVKIAKPRFNTFRSAKTHQKQH
jgi:membrane protein